MLTANAVCERLLGIAITGVFFEILTLLLAVSTKTLGDHTETIL